MIHSLPNRFPITSQSPQITPQTLWMAPTAFAFGLLDVAERDEADAVAREMARAVDEGRMADAAAGRERTQGIVQSYSQLATLFDVRRESEYDGRERVDGYLDTPEVRVDVVATHAHPPTHPHTRACVTHQPRCIQSIAITPQVIEAYGAHMPPGVPFVACNNTVNEGFIEENAVRSRGYAGGQARGRGAKNANAARTAAGGRERRGVELLLHATAQPPLPFCFRFLLTNFRFDFTAVAKVSVTDKVQEILEQIPVLLFQARRAPPPLFSLCSARPQASADAHIARCHLQGKKRGTI